ncbi:MAG TPA: phosphate signaling complex protein PhoU [Chloroflexota bacterium]|jgi:phosphate transport system protein|nr:phosphate signaling complex protein PhoU [Chloroflexota bacterium]HZU06237.1 phosphate signaling complex protein PhoU [Chloroflexota bacterium]
MDPRARYHQSLQALQDEMLLLGSMADRAVDRAITALRERDQEAARRIIEEDSLIDHKRYAIEEQAIELIATQQPMASDLRIIVAILNIIVELERIGDYAEGIAKIVLLLGDQPPLKRLIDIPRMADKARDMLRRSLDAFVLRDADAARAIASEDDEVDALHDQVYRELLTYMIEDPRTITRATYLIWVAHNLERIADRTTNICERVVFLVTGRLEEMNVSRY